MRTGAEYREALRDGRRVWVMGEGLVADVTTHPATSAMVEEYVAWYDRHFDPAWQEIAPPARRRRRTIPWAYVVPKTSEDLVGMGRSFAGTIFFTAGNITHTPAYGHLIALGVLTAVQEQNVSPKQIADAGRYRELIAATGRFLTFCGGAATIGFRTARGPGRAGRAQTGARNRCRGGASAAGSACIRARPMPRMSMSARSTGSRSTGSAPALSCRSVRRG